MTQHHFHADAMALYSWAADARGNLTFISPSLASYLSDDLGICEKGEEINRCEDGTIQVRAKDAPPCSTYVDLLRWLLADNRTIVDKAIAMLDADGAPEPAGNQGPGEQYESCDGAALTLSQTGWRKTTRQNGQAQIEVRTRSIRVIHPDGIRVNGGSPRDVVDLIVVQRFYGGTSTPASEHDGFQGQLQDAWPRVHPVMVNAVRAATLRLMTRSLSHNIGSHALNHIKNDLKGDQNVGVKDRTLHSRMYAYLRDRFEMLASVSVESPIPWSRSSIRDLCSSIHWDSGNHLLWKSICRSEGVTNIDINLDRISELVVGLPGDYVARHAFLIMIENLVRDCAKYERHAAGAEDQHEISLRIDATEDPDFNDFIAIEISATRSQTPAQVPCGTSPDRVIEETAAHLTRVMDSALCTSSGKPTKWGTLERLVCACLMRGWKPERLLPRLDGGPRGLEGTIEAGNTELDFQWALRAPRGEPNLLEVKPKLGSLTWKFYMPRPRLPCIVHCTSTAQRHRYEFASIDWHDCDEPLCRNRLPAGTSEIVIDARQGNIKHVADLARWNNLPGSVVLAAPTDDGIVAVPRWVARCNEVPRCREGMLRQMATARFPHCGSAIITNSEADVVWPESGGRAILLQHAEHRGCNVLQEAADKFLTPAKGGPRPEDWRWRTARGCEGFRFEAHESPHHLRALIDSSHAPNQREELRLELTSALLDRFLVLDERIGQYEGLMDSADWKGVTPRKRWALAGLDIAVVSSKEQDIVLFERFLKELNKDQEEKVPYRAVFVHLGLLEKFAQARRSQTGEDSGVPKVISDLLVAAGGPCGTTLVVHSGRNYPKELICDAATGFPLCKFSSLASLEQIITDELACKIQFVRYFNAL